MQVSKEGGYSVAFGLFFIVLVCKLFIDQTDPSETDILRL